ncbi:hypothetical protein EDB19DRAFT_1900814 [Suillus lakei]|nr:hypothetical protein EDB19DRAFT_1900814 [Suillus lakei]
MTSLASILESLIILYVFSWPPSVTHTTGSSTPASAGGHSSGLGSSALRTPLFAATPEDFLLFPGRSSHREPGSEKSRRNFTNLIGVRDSSGRNSPQVGCILGSSQEYCRKRGRPCKADARRAKKRQSPSVPVTKSVRRSNSSESDEDDVQTVTMYGSVTTALNSFKMATATPQ